MASPTSREPSMIHRRSFLPFMLVAAGLLLQTPAAPLEGQGADQWRGFPQTPPPAPVLPAGAIQLRYLGNAGWEITDGRTVVLVDPFVTQFARWTRHRAGAGDVPTATSTPADTALIRQHITRADYIVITHGHSDHALDAGHDRQAHRRRRSSATRPRSTSPAPTTSPDRSSITVVGGEDYDFDDLLAPRGAEHPQRARRQALLQQRARHRRHRTARAAGAAPPQPRTRKAATSPTWCAWRATRCSRWVR